MINLQAQTIILLLILAAQLMYLLQTIRFNRSMRRTHKAYYYWTYDQFKETRQRISQIKTRLADEERDDQRFKNKLRREHR